MQLYETDFSPMLAPNKQLPIDSLPLPALVSWKKDGVRCVLHKHTKYSKQMKTLPNINLTPLLREIAEYGADKGILFDGELCAPSVSFHRLSGAIRSYMDPLPSDTTYYLFDCLPQFPPTPNQEAFNYSIPFKNRIEFLNGMPTFDHVKMLPQHFVTDYPTIHRLLSEAIKDGCDGLILRSPYSKYKNGRGTLREGLIYKIKPYETFDSKIIRVIQATVAREGSERITNELGRSVTSKKQDDRTVVDMAAAFVIVHEGREEKIPLANMTHQVMREIWRDREYYVGKWIEWKGLVLGTVEGELPRSPKFIRFRNDLD